MSETRFFAGYVCVAGLYVLYICGTVIWSLACAGGNYLFWTGVGIALAGYFLVQIRAWHLVCQSLDTFFLRSYGKTLGMSGKGKLTSCRIILSAALMTSFVFWMERCSFFLFGCCEGVPLFQPLIFLLDSFSMRHLISLVGVWPTLFLLHISVLIFCVRRWGVVVRSSLLVVVFGSFFIEREAQPPLWLTRCVVLRSPFVPGSPVDISAHVQSVAHQVAALEVYQDLVFMPESAMPFPLDNHPFAHAALCSLSRGRTLFLGTHRRSSQCSRDVFNAALCLRDGHEFFWHDKTHGMIGLERLPVFFQWGSIMRGLQPLLGDGFFAQAAQADDVMTGGCVLEEGLVLEPLICSEFFYCYGLRGLAPDTVIVALVNDAWFAGTAIPYLLWSVARLKSLLLSRRVLYISYRYAGLFDITGDWFAL